MDQLFSDAPDKAEGIGTLYRTMSEHMAPVARYLLREPIGGGLVAAPTFEVYELSRDDPAADLRAAARRAVEHHPSLTGVVDSLV